MGDLYNLTPAQAVIEASETDPAFARFENAVVRSSIHYAFWHGACMYDVLQAGCDGVIFGRTI